MRTSDEFQQAQRSRGITQWVMHHCRFCNYPVRFIFPADGSVFFDRGCYCVMEMDEWEPQTWGDIAAHYNRQNHPDVIAQMDEFWGFARDPVAVSSHPPGVGGGIRREGI